MKLKLKPSARLKKRYILFNTNKQEKIEEFILDSLGTLGWAKASPVFIKNKDKLILSINRAELENIRAALELSPNEIKILSISGTLKGIRKR